MAAIVGMRSRTGCNHAVIARNGLIVYDPSPSDAGIIGPLSGYPEVGFELAYLAVAGGFLAGESSA